MGMRVEFHRHGKMVFFTDPDNNVWLRVFSVPIEDSGTFADTLLVTSTEARARHLCGILNMLTRGEGKVTLETYAISSHVEAVQGDYRICIDAAGPAITVRGFDGKDLVLDEVYDGRDD